MASTFTWTGASGSNWDISTNWAPGPPSFDNNGLTTIQDSLSFNQGASAYTSVFAANGADQVYDLTINGSNATLLAGAAGQLNIANSIVVNAGTLDLGNGGELTYLANQGPAQRFVLDGTLQGAGFVDAQDPAITGTGTIAAVNDGPGTELYLGSPVGLTAADTLAVQVQAGAIAEMQSSVASGVTVDVAAGASLLLDDLPDFKGSVSGLTVTSGANATLPSGSNSIDLTSVNPGNITAVSLHNGSITITDPTNGSGSVVLSGNYTGDFANYVSDGNSGTTIFIDNTVCFAAGTHILTPDGNVEVETIGAGDLIIAMVDGQPVPRSVKWIGYRKLVLNQHGKAPCVAPIRIKRDALAEGLPARDLLVSPPHCLFIDGKLIPAKLLVNDMTILWDTGRTSVEYYHIELDRHAILIAEGVPSESYLDTGNRAFFSNAGMAMILHPEFHVNAGLRCWATDACAPLAVSPAAVLPVWRPLADRAVDLGYRPPTYATTKEADIHLLADGRRIDTILVTDQVYSFLVPGGVKSLALASRSVVPSLLAPYLDDPRRLGVAIRRITIRGMAGRQEFAADHRALAGGWHAPEQADGALWRWTNGCAALPSRVVDGPVVVEISVSETTTYVIDDIDAGNRLAA